MRSDEVSRLKDPKRHYGFHGKVAMKNKVYLQNTVEKVIRSVIGSNA